MKGRSKTQTSAKRSGVASAAKPKTTRKSASPAELAKGASSGKSKPKTTGAKEVSDLKTGGTKSSSKAPAVKEAVSKATAKRVSAGAKEKPTNRVSKAIALNQSASGNQAAAPEKTQSSKPTKASPSGNTGGKTRAGTAAASPGKPEPSANTKSRRSGASAAAGRAGKPPAAKSAANAGSVSERLREMQQRREQAKDLSQPVSSRVSLTHQNSTTNKPPDPSKDRLVLLVRDPYWLHATWDITRRTVQRVKASLAGQWHTVKPTLRLMNAADAGTTSNAESVLCDIEIHSGVRNWFIPISNPPGAFVAAIGYLTSDGRFHELCRSNRVRTPAPGSSDAVDDHWADIARDAERIFGLSGGYDEDYRSDELRSMIEARLNRPLSNLTGENFGSGNGSLSRSGQFFFELDVELVIFGATPPDSRLLVGGEPAHVREDGTFAIRHPMPNTRQVIPITARNRDGTEEQTIVIAVERNTKTMDPVSNGEADD